MKLIITLLTSAIDSLIHNQNMWALSDTFKIFQQKNYCLN